MAWADLKQTFVLYAESSSLCMSIWTYKGRSNPANLLRAQTLSHKKAISMPAHPAYSHSFTASYSVCLFDAQTSWSPPPTTIMHLRLNLALRSPPTSCQQHSNRIDSSPDQSTHRSWTSVAPLHTEVGPCVLWILRQFKWVFWWVVPTFCVHTGGGVAPVIGARLRRWWSGVERRNTKNWRR